MSDKPLPSDASQKVDEFIEQLKKYPSAEERLQKMLKFMQKELAEGEVKHLNRFWKMRQYCLEQFKENLYLSKRAQFWKIYQGIVSEIIRMKAVLDEKILSDKEEILKVLQDTEKDLKEMSGLIEQSDPIELPAECLALQKNQLFYQKSQKELNIVHVFAKRLNALKAELIELDIPYGQKHSMLGKVHELSDLVFPRKRELLNQISKKYMEDVQHFIREYQEKKEIKPPFFELKEQIKQLQSAAKILSLNVTAFSQAREKLSQFWDQIRTTEKEHKKQKEQKRALILENESRLKDRIKTLQDNKEKLSKKEFEKEVTYITDDIQNKDLQKLQRKKLKELLVSIDESLIIQDAHSQEHDPAIQLFAQLKDLQEQLTHLDYHSLYEHIQNAQNTYDGLTIVDAQQNKILRSFSYLKEALMEKLLKEIETEEGSAQIQSTHIESFKKIFKTDIEKYRRALNTSNQSIEKAMLYNELLTQTKHKLAEFDQKIKHVLNS